MPSPPKHGETKREFIDRCIPYLIREGKTKEQASGQCYRMWDSHSKKKAKNKKWYSDMK